MIRKFFEGGGCAGMLLGFAFGTVFSWGIFVAVLGGCS